MKIYEITTPIQEEYAQLRLNIDQSNRDSDSIEACWDDWGVTGNNIGDFVFSNYNIICKHEIFSVLNDRFTGLKSCPIKLVENPKEMTTKNPSRLKWLPNNRIFNFDIIYTNIEVSLLPTSTIKYELINGKRYI